MTRKSACGDDNRHRKLSACQNLFATKYSCYLLLNGLPHPEYNIPCPPPTSLPFLPINTTKQVPKPSDSCSERTPQTEFAYCSRASPKTGLPHVSSNYKLTQYCGSDQTPIDPKKKHTDTHARKKEPRAGLVRLSASHFVCLSTYLSSIPTVSPVEIKILV